MSPEFAPIVFAVFAGGVIALYVTLDGFDLGVGILFPFAPRSADRDLMMASLAPAWDGNETWLVLGGMILFAGFPNAFAVLLPAFYAPLAAMLAGLVLRGVAFEFRSQRGPDRIAWTGAFVAGSVLAAFCQGVVLGAFVTGRVAVRNGAFAGGALDWLSPFTVVTGAGVVAGYALLGAAWLIWRTSGPTQVFAREIARPALIATGAAIVLVSVWTPWESSAIRGRWFDGPWSLWLDLLPVVAGACWLGAWKGLWASREWLPMLMAVLLFLVSLAGLGASVWPDAIPGRMTIWQASSLPQTQALVAPILAGIVPIVLGYVAFSYWVFRGKVRVEGARY